MGLTRTSPIVLSLKILSPVEIQRSIIAVTLFMGSLAIKSCIRLMSRTAIFTLYTLLWDTSVQSIEYIQYGRAHEEKIRMLISCKFLEFCCLTLRILSVKYTAILSL